MESVFVVLCIIIIVIYLVFVRTILISFVCCFVKIRTE